MAQGKDKTAINIRFKNEDYEEIKKEAQAVGSSINSFVLVLVRMGFNRYKAKPKNSHPHHKEVT